MHGSAAPGETFAAYFARYLIARRGYAAGTQPELQPLARACDQVLVRTGGAGLEIAAIVDREADPERSFGLSAEETAAVAQACRPRAGRAARAGLPVTITVYEIGPGVVDLPNMARLAPYRREGLSSKSVLRAWLLDTETRQAWTNMAFGGRFGPRRAMERLLGAPRLDEARLAPRRREIADRRRAPVLTFALIALLAAIFAGEAGLGLDRTAGLLTPSLRTLQAFGGLSYPLVVDGGQWWRLFTAPLLHADAVHIFFNVLALFLIGRVLEPLIGWRWMAGVFAISALGGSLASLAVNPHDLIGVGASGGIVGLFAAGLIASFRMPAGVLRSRLQARTVYGLLPALLPFFNAAREGSRIDYGAHAGGAAAGAAMGLVLLALWPGYRPRPRWANAGAALGALFFAVAAGAAVPLAEGYRRQGLLAADWPPTSRRRSPKPRPPRPAIPTIRACASCGR